MLYEDSALLEFGALLNFVFQIKNLIFNQCVDFIAQGLCGINSCNYQFVH